VSGSGVDGAGRWSISAELNEQLAESARREQRWPLQVGGELLGSCSVNFGESPPLDLVDVLSPQLIPTDLGHRVESVATHQEDLIALAVVAGGHGERMLTTPDVRSDLEIDEAELLAELTPKAVDGQLIGFQATTRRGPDHRCGEFESNQQHIARLVVDDERSRAGAPLEFAHASQLARVESVVAESVVGGVAEAIVEDAKHFVDLFALRAHR